MRLRLGLSFALLGIFACGEANDRSHKHVSRNMFTKAELRKKSKRNQRAVARSSARCGECHGAYERTWKASSHAKAATSPYFRASANGDGRCAPCHTPLVGEIADDDPIHEEGVTCDACHSIIEVNDDAPSPGLIFDLTASIKYGPLCDSEGSYFHRSGCSPLHSKSRLCAGCHSLEWPSPNGEMLPVITDFDEWSAKGGRGATCQDCHMSGTPGEVARGFATREKISRHDLFGADEELLRASINLRASLRTGEEGSRDLEVTLTNRGALHSIPAGLAGRRFVLSINFIDIEGRSVGQAARVYARILVDAQGREVFFTEARALREDNRLHPGERRMERFRIPPSTTIAKVRLERFALAPEVAARLGLAVPQGSLVHRTDVIIESDNP